MIGIFGGDIPVESEQGPWVNIAYVSENKIKSFPKLFRASKK
jgi:hypothetical protein